MYLFDTIDMAWVGVRVSRFVSIFLPGGRKIIVWLRRAVASGAHPRRILMFESLIQKKKAETVNTVSAFLVRVSRFELEAS